jgi:hypothetical protein
MSIGQLRQKQSLLAAVRQLLPSGLLPTFCSCKKIMKTKGWPDPESNSPWAKDVSAACAMLS